METFKVVVLDLGVKRFHRVVSWYLFGEAGRVPEPVHSASIYRKSDIRAGINLELWLVPNHPRLQAMRDDLLADVNAVILVSGPLRASEINDTLDDICRSLPPGIEPWRACVQGDAPRRPSRIRIVNPDTGAGISELMESVIDSVSPESLQKQGLKQRLQAWIRNAEGEGDLPDFIRGFSFFGRWQAGGRRLNWLTAKALLARLEAPDASVREVFLQAASLRATIEPGLCFFRRRITSESLMHIVNDGLVPLAP